MRNIRNWNPYSILAFSLLAVLVVYKFGWSTIYPKISLKLTVFLVAFILLLLFASWIISPTIGDMIRDSENKKIRYSPLFFKVLIIIIILGTVMDGIYSRGFPIFGNVVYNTFGIPIIHPIIGILSVFLTIYSAQLLFVNKKKSSLIRIAFAFSLLPSILAFSRGTLILSLLIVVLMASYSGIRVVSIKNVITISILFFVSMFLFGVAGNYRLNNQIGIQKANLMDSSFVYELGGANEKVKDDSVISPFFWSYLYFTSPMANLQAALDDNLSLSDSTTEEYLVTQFMPDVVSTKLYPNYKDSIQNNGYNSRVNGSLTVSTAFYGSFIQMGWTGVLLMSIFFLVFPIFYLLLIYKINPEFIIMSVSILNCLYLLSVFDNPWSFSAISVQLLLVILLAIFMPKQNN